MLHPLFELLSTEVSALRLIVWGVVLCAGGSSAIVYLFPVTHADGLTLINMISLLLTGFYFASATVGFESDLVLSNVLSNRPREIEWSLALFIYVLIPFLVLAILVEFVQQPGVLQWSGSILSFIWDLAQHH